MSDSTSFSTPDPRPTPARPRISWVAVLGFGALGLVWPLLQLLGVGSVIGELVTALLTLLAVCAVWVLGAGFGVVPRPILTLTLSGAMFGVLLSASALVLGEWPDHGPGLALVAAAIEIGRATGLGALAGLGAAAIQRARRR